MIASRDHEMQLRNYFATLVDIAARQSPMAYRQHRKSYNVQFNQGTVAQLHNDMEGENDGSFVPIDDEIMEMAIKKIMNHFDMPTSHTN